MSKLLKILKNVLLAAPFLLLAIFIIYPNAFTLFRGIRIETVSDMQEQMKKTPQEADGFFTDSASMRPAPERSIPVNAQRYPHTMLEYEKASELVNPLPADDYVLARGKNRYQIFCVICHGEDGKGNGRIVTQPKLTEDEEGFPQPADLTSENTKNYSDGRLFHILSAGQNLMFPVNFKTDTNDRWALVHYIRYLQKNQDNR